MDDQVWLARQFEENRSHLRKVAVRMLGSESEADDAVQETWLRLSRSGSERIDNLAGWLTTVVARICLDLLRSRRSRGEEELDDEEGFRLADEEAADPEREALLADSLGPALLVILDLLSPPERVAFVLHDLFGMGFDEVAPIVGRSAEASRQLASRARRRLRGSVSEEGGVRSGERSGERSDRRIVDAFLVAARSGDLATLLSLLDPACVLRADEFALTMGAPQPIEGGAGVAAFFNGKAAAASRVSIGGVAGAAWAPGGSVRVAFKFSFKDGKISAIELIADRRRLAELGVELLED